MIAPPFNDHACLGALTEQIAAMVEADDETVVQLAEKFPTTDALQGWMRSLPQRDDNGLPGDGPKIEACSPPQRFRLAPDDPNCFERSALYVAVAERINPGPVRCLGTFDTPMGRHTVAIEDGQPVILNPDLPRNCIDCAVALCAEGPVAIDPRTAIDWTIYLAEAGAMPLRNGVDRVSVGRDAIHRLIEHGIAPGNQHEVDVMGWLLSLAERAARDYGPRALAIVRSTALALVRLVDEALARAAPPPPPPAPYEAQEGRNVALKLDGFTIRPAPWASALGRIAARVGVHVGGSLLSKKLAALGVGADVVAALERELASEGLRLNLPPAGKPAAPPA